MLVFALLLLAPGSAGFRFDGFASASELQLVGNARIEQKIAVRLTPNKHDRAGAVWFQLKQPIATRFDTEFTFRISKSGGLGGGADGIAFVMQNKGTHELGGQGGSGGFAAGDGGQRDSAQGIPESIAVFFDTFQNETDPSNNYIGVFNNGRYGEMRWPPPRLATSENRIAIDMKDGQIHRARIAYERPLLSVWLDGKPMVRTPVDLRAITGPNGKAWLGLTASTGGGFGNHDILSWRFEGEQVDSGLYDVSSQISYHLADCMEGRNLCTPEKAVVEEASAGEWRVLLPAHLEWGASVPASAVEIREARGTVCFGPNGESGCANGAEAIRQKVSNGRVWFSTARDGVAGQGFVDFRVRLK